MSTAHKPQLKQAVVGTNQEGNIVQRNRIFSARDLPGHMTVKERKEGQFRRPEFQYKDFRKELLEKEKKLKLKNSKGQPQQQQEQQQMKQLEQYSDDDEEVEDKVQKKVKPNQGELPEVNENDNENENENKDEPVKKLVQQHQNLFPQDADDSDFMDSSDSDQPKKQKNKQNNDDAQNQNSNDEEDNSSGSSDDSSDEDDLLMQEFEKIKQQKELEEKQKQEEKFKNLEENEAQQYLSGNPLLADGQYSLKKAWYEDTVFKNQARTERKEKKRFINDNVRSDFHKKFLKKYIGT